MRFFLFPTTLTITFVGCVLLSACSSKKEPPKQTPQVISVDVIIAKQQTVTSLIEANGTVIANDYVQLRPEVAGRIVYLNVPEGKKVAKGTIIAKLNSEDLAAQKAKSQVLLDLAITTEGRLHKLLAINGINQADYDAAVNTINSYKADIVYYNALISKTIIKAPFTGIMGLRMVSVGAFISTSDIIASLQQEGGLKIDFTLPEQYSGSIKKGAEVSVITDTDTSKRKRATIIATEPQINTATRNLMVRALLQSGTANIGAFVKIEVNTNSNKNAIMVPTNAIIPNDKSKQVVVVKNGKAFYANITTGVRQENNVEITSGINVGDSIVVTGVLFTKPNVVVKIKSVKKLEEVGK